MRILIVVTFSALVSLVAAQTCPAAPEPWGDPWPSSASVDEIEAEKIRCALVAALQSDRVDRLPTDIQPRVRARRVGPTWSDGGRPRIGTFWFERDGDEVTLRDTLFMNENVRIGLVVELRRRGRRWVVTSLTMRADPSNAASNAPAFIRFQFLEELESRQEVKGEQAKRANGRAILFL